MYYVVSAREKIILEITCFNKSIIFLLFKFNNKQQQGN